MNGILRDLMQPRHCRTRRVSSWDKTGGNRDYWPIGPGEAKTLADIQGPGILTHIWMTSGAKNGIAHWTRRVRIRIYWDGQETPSVDAPLGDFFGCGHGLIRRWQSIAMDMTGSQDAFSVEHNTTAFNCWLPMPFQQNARVEIYNDGDGIGLLYFYIDYEEYDPGALPADLLYFHAHFRRECPTDGWKDKFTPNHGDPVDSTPNLDGKGNYVVLETTGRGHYIGCNVSIHNQTGSWWGEGDDMIFIDGDEQPTINGTGTEDYFNHAYGMQHIPDGLYHGVSVFQPDNPDKDLWRGKTTCYRWHIPDPIVFQKSIKVTIEHGHANARSDDWSSVAYWYQTLPTPALPPVPEARLRLPVEP
ncbi:MAG TPA: glycoside hydrolase family 172 protein [Chthonomonadaceae bacterium]|nr:glycoside hydrolase family 172 protein [Chthonomonadaceae bacterium]